MDPLTLDKLLPTLQTAIGPAILISGVGLLLLTMTNRLGLVIARVRGLAVESPETAGFARHQRSRQLNILWKRARIIRLAIMFASASALCAALLIASIFLMALCNIDYSWLIALLFIASMACLISSLAVFIKDINHTLEALHLEISAQAPSSKR
ncbi:DUF2721 domain-containing protein [Elusimicrobiota bacterium]